MLKVLIIFLKRIVLFSPQKSAIDDTHRLSNSCLAILQELNTFYVCEVPRAILQVTEHLTTETPMG